MSVDGRWLAYDGSQCSGIASVGQVADFGLNDLAEARITFERLAQPGAPRIEDVVVAGGQPAVLVSSEGADRTDREQDHTVTWLDRNGEANGQSVSTSPGKLTWLPRRARVLSDNQCQLELLDLPSRNADAARP